MAALETLDDSSKVPAQVSAPLPDAYLGGRGLTMRQASGAKVLQVLNDATNDWADREAIKAGTEEGMKAGMKPDFAPLRGTSLYAQAFDRAGLDSYGSQVETSAMENAQRIYTEHKGDPKSMDTALQAYADGTMKTLPDEMQPKFREIWARRSMAYLADARQEFEKNTIDNTIASNAVALLAQKNSVAGMARTIPNDQVFAQEVGKERELFLQKLLNHAPREGGEFEGRKLDADPTRLPAYTWQQIAEQMHDFDSEIVTQRVMGKFDRAANKTGFMQHWVKEARASGGDVMTPEMIDKIETKMHVEIGRIKSEQALNSSVALSALKTVDDRMAAGYDIPAEEMASVASLVSSTGDKRIAQMYQSLQAQQDYAKMLTQSTPQEVAAEVMRLQDATRQDGASQSEVARLNMAQKYQAKMSTDLKNDPLEFASRTGFAQVQPLNVQIKDGQLQFDAGALYRRARQADAVSGRYGSEYKIFTEQEAGSLANVMPSLPVDQQLGFLRAVTTAAGNDGAVRAMQQLGQKDAVLGYAGGLANIEGGGGVNTAREVLQGRRILAENPDRKPSEQTARLDFQDMVGNIFANNPASERAAFDSAVALYAQRRVTQGKPTSGQKNYDNETFKQAVRDVMGGVNGIDPIYDGHFAANKLALPPQVEAEAFDDFVKSLDDNDLSQFSASGNAPKWGDGTPVSAEDFKKNLKLEQIGAGKYLARNGDLGYFHGGPSWANGAFVLKADWLGITDKQLRAQQGKK